MSSLLVTPEKFRFWNVFRGTSQNVTKLKCFSNTHTDQPSLTKGTRFCARKKKKTDTKQRFLNFLPSESQFERFQAVQLITSVSFFNSPIAMDNSHASFRGRLFSDKAKLHKRKKHPTATVLHTDRQVLTNNRWPMTDDRWPMTGDRWPMTDTLKKKCPFLRFFPVISNYLRKCLVPLKKEG